MKESVEDSRGSGDIADEFAPFLKGPVGGHEGGFSLVAAHDDLEEMFAGTVWQLLDAHVVDDEQVALEVAFHDALMGEVMAVGLKIIEDVKDGAVEDESSLLDEFVTDSLGEMAFADTWGPDKEDVLGPGEELAGGELVDLLPVDGGVEGKVEAVEGALFAEVGGLGAAADEALMADVEFIL